MIGVTLNLQPPIVRAARRALFLVGMLVATVRSCIPDPAPASPGVDLAGAVAASAPHLERLQADANVAAARGVAGLVTVAGRDFDVTPELLLAMAWVESRYVPTGVSRLECADGDCRRVRGDWPARFPARFRGPYFCGVLQAKAWTEPACRAIGADLVGSYAAAADHLVDWLRFCAADGRARRHRDRLSCALAGYNGGVAAAREGRQRYARAVLSRARRLADGWPAPRSRGPDA